MRVFKGYLQIVFKNSGLLLMYLLITVSIVFISQKNIETNDTSAFSAARYRVAVLDREGGKIGNVLTEYIARNQILAAVADDKQAIWDELFYRNIQCVLIVPEDAAKKLAEGGAAVQIVSVPGSAGEYYLHAKINNLLQQIRVYTAGGFSMEEACEKALELSQKEASVTLLDVNGNAGRRPDYNDFFAYLPYGFLGGMIISMSFVVMEFKKKEIKRRITCSPVSARVQNSAAIACFLTVGVLVWGVCIAVQSAVYHGGAFRSENRFCYLLNSLACMTVAMSLAYLTGMAAGNAGALNGIANVISLGLCFLGGIFVPIEMLGSGVEKAARFLPTYWYSKINGLLGDYARLNSGMLQTVMQGLLIQFLFAAACFGVTTAVTKARQRE